MLEVSEGESKRSSLSPAACTALPWIVVGASVRSGFSATTDLPSWRSVGGARILNSTAPLLLIFIFLLPDSAVLSSTYLEIDPVSVFKFVACVAYWVLAWGIVGYYLEQCRCSWLIGKAEKFCWRTWFLGNLIDSTSFGVGYFGSCPDDTTLFSWS